LHALIRANTHNDTLPQLEKNIDRVSRFINSLLRLAKMDFTEQIEMRPISLSDLLLELTEEFEVIAQESGMKLCSHIAQGIMIKGDRNKIVEMVSNLVSNAMKYNAHEMRVDVLLEKQGSQAVLSIADTGVGIAAYDIPYIFDRFFRAEDVSGSGTGLGLAICKKIVHMHGGTIEVESEKGEGARFVVRLPLLS
jgi:signal transduction histidine kinase